MNIAELIDGLPKDTKEKVEAAKKNYNKLIREAMRFESRLSLNSGHSIVGEDDLGVRI